MPCELEDLMMSSTAKLSSCCVLVATCPELVFSCSIVVRHVLKAVLKQKKFKATPSFVRHTILVKLTQEDDVACLHKTSLSVARPQGCLHEGSHD